MVRLNSRWLISLSFYLGVVFFGSSIPAFAATYYVDPAAANDTGTGSSTSPKKYITSGIKLMASGDTLILRDGTYTGTNNFIGDFANPQVFPPNGTAGNFTTIKAEHVGQAIIDGQYTNPVFSVQNIQAVNYLHLDGIHFRRGSYGVFVLMGAHNWVSNCGFEDGGPVTNNDEWPIAIIAGGSSYTLVEDCWVWGRGRYGLYTSSPNGGTNHVIFRRVVARLDDTPGSWMVAGLRFYNSNTNIMQNCVVIDNNISPTAGFPEGIATGGGSSGSEQNHYFIGNIVLNNPNQIGFSPEKLDTAQTFTNNVLWGNMNGFQQTKDWVTSSSLLTMSNLTVGNDKLTSAANSGLGFRAGYTGYINLSNTLLQIPDTGTGFVNSGNISVTNSNYFIPGTGGLGDSHGGLTSINSTAFNAGLKYLPRIETGSTLANAGVGANILYQTGATGAFYGDANYNTLTSSPLWPFSNEQLWATKMKAYTASGPGGNRGFAAVNSSTPLTDYIWGYLGNPKPDIYGSATDTTPPTVSITSPTAGATATGTVSVAASASDNVGVTKVELYVNGALQASDTSSPYLFSWNTSSLAAGTYTLMAKAYDAAGNVAQSSNVSVSVVTDTTAPAVSLTAPANGATISGTVAITASASDNVGVSKVEFYDNGTLLGATNIAPYSYSWNTGAGASGSHTLNAKAYDAAGNVAQSANDVVTVSNTTADTTAPTVSVTAPANGATVSGTTTISATASDNVGVTKVEFYLNGALQSTSTAAPYSYSWNTTAVANGSYTIAAKAYDAAGNVGQSGNVAVTVNNPTTTTASAYTIWPAATVPGVVDSGPDNSVEVGVKFRSDVSGYVTGVRFYKASTNTGTHVGNLWTSTGTLLATATFSNETASGWQQVNFAKPVAITANTVYVASYHTSAGHYSDDQNFFATKGVDAPPLHALANGVSGYNGVFAYGSSSSFPNQGWNSSNYWVDVAFTAGTSSDTTPPTVSITAPAANATVSGTVAVTASASDNVGVSKVEFYVNGALKATATASPYAFNWDTTASANGAYTLTAKAYDAAGNVGQSSSVTVNVSNAAADTTPPTVTIISPTAGAKVGRYTTVSASATDNIAVTKMELYIDNALKATTSSGSLTWTWNVARGTHVIKVNAYDAANNVGSQSETVYR